MSSHYAGGNRRTRFHDKTADRLYRQARQHAGRMLHYGAGRIPAAERETWRDIRTALAARLAELAAPQQPQPPATEAPPQ